MRRLIWGRIFDSEATEVHDGAAMFDETENDPEGWVDRHGDALYRYAMLRLRSPDVVADIVQETFLHALRSRDAFAGRSSERTWLIGILRHKILDQYRRNGASRPAVRGMSDLEDRAGMESEYDVRGHWRNEPKSWGNDPSRALEVEEFWGVFHNCLDKMPRSLADAFFLREVDGLEAAEVQRELGLSPANLWTRLHRARTLLRGCLQQNWFDGPTAAATLIEVERSDPSSNATFTTPAKGGSTS